MQNHQMVLYHIHKKQYLIATKTLRISILYIDLISGVYINIKQVYVITLLLWNLCGKNYTIKHPFKYKKLYIFKKY